MAEKPAYIVVDVDIHNPEIYEDYKKQVVPIVTAFGGEYIARGGAADVVRDELWRPPRMVLLKFPSVALQAKPLWTTLNMPLSNRCGWIIQ